MVNWTVIAYLSCCVTNKQTGTVAENAACLARMTMTTVRVKVIHVLPKLSLLIMTSYASSADMLASLFPQSQKKKANSSLHAPLPAPLKGQMNEARRIDTNVRVCLALY